MILIELDDRLVAVNDEAAAGVVWNGVEWAQTGGDFPRRAWIEGEQISPEEAAQRFPEAKFDAIPALS